MGNNYFLFKVRDSTWKTYTIILLKIQTLMFHQILDIYRPSEISGRYTTVFGETVNCFGKRNTMPWYANET